MVWYYLHGEARRGPIGEETFEQLVAEGTIHPETRVWQPGMTHWTPLEALGSARMAREGDGPRKLPCMECRELRPAAEMLPMQGQCLCGACKPTYLMRLREGNLKHAGLPYARFWRRAVAKFLDYGLMALYTNAIAVLLGVIFTNRDVGEMVDLGLTLVLILISVVLQGIYHVWFIGKYGATLGKMALGIKIVTPDGGKVSYLRAFARYLLEGVSSFALYLGYIMAAYDDRYRTLHDMFCHTRVVLDIKEEAKTPAFARETTTLPQGAGGAA